MSDIKNFPIPDFKKIGDEVLREIRTTAGSEAVKFFKESFVKEGFTDTSFTAWKKTSNPFAGKRTLYNKGILMQSIRKASDNSNIIIVESDTQYSAINNDGGFITVTPQLKKYFWARYYDLSGKKKGVKAKNTAKANFCKAMALKKVGSKIIIPKRQFMGNSAELMNLLDRKLSEIILKEGVKPLK